MNKEYLKKILNNFPEYLDYVYTNIDLPHPTSTQTRIAEHLGENNSRLILEAFRGVGKTWVTAAYATWRLIRNIDEKILIVSASGQKAAEISQFMRRLFIEVPLLNHLQPVGNDRDSVVSFDVHGCKIAVSPSVKSLGITSQLTGSRASLVILDDIEVPSNSATELMRAKLIQRAQEVEALLIPDMPSSVVMLGTPQSMESVYNKLPYPTVIIPAEVPEDPTIYEGKLDDWVFTRGKAGAAVDERFPKDILIERRSFYGLSGYNLQFMLDTTLADEHKFPLKLKDLIVTPLSAEQAPLTISYAGDSKYVIPELANLGFTGDRYHSPFMMSETFKEYDFKCMAIDPSGQGADETTWAILGVLNGTVYVLDIGGTNKGYSTEALFILSSKAKEYQVNEILIEKNFGDGMFRALLEPVLASIHPCTISDVRAIGQKEIRIINAIEPLTTNHKLVVSRELIERDIMEALKDPQSLPYSFLHQYTHICGERGALVHDDRLDSLAMACEHIKDMVMIDPAKEADKYIQQEADKMLDKIFALATNQYGREGGKSMIGYLKRGRKL